MYKVLYFDYAPEDVYDIIRSHVPPGFELVTLKEDSEEERRGILPDVDFLVVATAKVTKDHFQIAKKLKMIQHQGVGYDGTDVEEAKKRGILIGLTPEGTTIGVAEHTILLILAVYKRLVTAHISLQKGQWLQFGLRSVSFELHGKTLGLLGFGRIGQETAKRALAFGARVIYHDPYLPASVKDTVRSYGQEVDFPTLLQEADILSLHIPLTPETRGIIHRNVFTQMKPSAILINTARGKLVVEKDLIEALQTKRIAGAGLDVFETEPVSKDNPLLFMDNVILTPHIAAGTADALHEKMRAVFANLVRFVQGERPKNLIGI